MPDNVNVPEPAFTTLPVSLITPEKVVDVLSPPAVNVPEPSVTLPLPASDPMLSEISFKSNVPLAPTVMAVESDNLPEPLNCNVPALIVVAPLYVFAAERINVPVSAFVNAFAPLIMPLKVNVPVLLIVLLASKAIVPESELVPVLVNAVPPFKVSASAPIATPAIFNAAPLATVVPAAVVPKAASLAALNVPTLIVVVPV